MPLALSDALASPNVVAAAQKAGFDLNNPANVSRLLAYAGVSGFQLETENNSGTSAPSKSLAQSTLNAALVSPAVQTASRQAGLNLFDSAQFEDLFGLSTETLTISAAGISAAEQSKSDLFQSRVLVTTQNIASRAPSAYVNRALSMYAQIAAMA